MSSIGPALAALQRIRLSGGVIITVALVGATTRNLVLPETRRVAATKHAMAAAIQSCGPFAVADANLSCVLRN